MRKTASQIADEVIVTPTEEMIDHFNNRTNRHIELVRKYCTKLEERIPGLDGLHKRSLRHDDSKFEPREKIPYIWLTWRYKCEDDKKPLVLPTGMKRMIDEATEHHILSNAHHPEFHQSKRSGLLNTDDRDKPPKEMIDSTKMSKLDIGEMVADWCAMSEERGNTPHEWAKKNVNVRWKFTPEQEKHIFKLIDAAWDRHKTASQIGDEVLEKLSIDLATLRRVSSDIMKQHGVRGGMSIDPWSNTISNLRRPTSGGRIAFGPALSPEMRQSGRVIQPQQLLGYEKPEQITYNKGPIFSGGRHGSFVDIANSQLGQQAGLVAPSTPLGKETVNRLGLLHEGLERQALKPGTTLATRAKNWGKSAPTLAGLGMVGGGHMSPGVVLRESNIVGTLPKGVPQESARQMLGPLRNLEGTWPTIQKAVGRDLPYGQQRLSRHAIRHIENLVQQPTPVPRSRLRARLQALFSRILGSGQ